MNLSTTRRTGERPYPPQLQVDGRFSYLVKWPLKTRCFAALAPGNMKFSEYYMNQPKLQNSQADFG
jgi:hypothetical protein